MTEQEALKEIKDIHSGKSTQLLQDNNTPTLERWLLRSCEALELAEKALEKQIAKKPQRNIPPILYEAGWRYRCPSCKCAVGENVKDVELDFTQCEPYCPECGQKLLWDWGNEDAE